MRWCAFLISSLLFASTANAVDVIEVQSLREAGEYPRCVDAARQALDRVEPQSIEAADLQDLLCHCQQRDGTDSVDELLTLTAETIELRESLVGADHPSLGPALRNRGRILWTADRIEEARTVYQRALDIQLAHDSDQVELALAHLGVANMATLQNELEVAQDHFDRALELSIETGAKNIEASVRNSSRRLLLAQDRDDDALREVESAIRLQREDNPTHPGLGIFLANLGRLHRNQDRDEEAAEAYREALSIAQRWPEHPRVGYTHRDLGRVLVDLEQHGAAQGHFEAAAAQLLDRPAHVTAGLSALQLQGAALIEMYRFEAAADVLERAKELREAHLGPDDPGLAAVYTYLGRLDRDIGDYQQARRQFQEALRIRRAKYGEQDRRVAESLLNLADAEWYLGNADTANRLSQQALGTGKLRGEQWGLAATNVALYSLELDDLATAEALLEQARPVFRQTYEPTSQPMVALESVEGQIAQKKGEHARAVIHLRNVVELRKSQMGESHPQTGLALEDLAIAQRLAGEPGAFDHAMQAESITREFLQLTARSLPDRQALRAKPQYYAGLDTALLLALDQRKQNWLERAAEALFASRSLVLDAVGQRRQVIRGLGSPAQTTWRRLQVARRSLARAAVAPQVSTAELEQLRQEKESLERELARLGNDAPVSVPAEVSALQAALPERTALVSYARMADHDHRGDVVWRLVALVLTKTSLTGHGLGEASAAEAAIDEWRGDLLEGLTDPTSARHLASGRRLRQLMWDPLEADLGDKSQVFLVLDGHVQLVSFAALPTDDGGFLVESRRFHRLGAERDLLHPKSDVRNRGSMLAVGDPNFAPAHADPNDCSLAGLRFEPLPATRDEIKAVTELWEGSAITLAQTEADEASFKRHSAGHRLLHLATHGFFLGDDCQPGAPGTRGIGRVVRRGSSRRPAVDSPLLRCGLAFAGANQRQSSSAREEDGVLLAEEILNLDLSGTEWAVLSACDTGVGRVERGEGVVGLSRAFTLAGVQTLVMSLWPVQDQATRDWMRELYTARWQDGLDTVESVHRARTRALSQRRAQGQSIHPFYWAAFVSYGEWR